MPQALPNLTTERLLISAFTEEDLEDLHRIHADPDVTRYIGGEKTLQDSRFWLRQTLSWYRDYGIGQLAVRRREDLRLIGRCGLSWFELESGTTPAAVPRCYWGKGVAPEGMAVTPLVELGYTFGRDAWGMGFATEAAAAMRDWAFHDAGYQELVAVIDDNNQGSAKVAERLGFHRESALLLFGDPAWLYRLVRE